MAFEPQNSITPASIGAIVVTLKDAFDENGQPYQSAAFELRIIMSDGSTKRRAGDLGTHITPQQRQALMNFMDSLRAQAEDQIL